MQFSLLCKHVCVKSWALFNEFFLEKMWFSLELQGKLYWRWMWWKMWCHKINTTAMIWYVEGRIPLRKVTKNHTNQLECFPHFPNDFHHHRSAGFWFSFCFTHSKRTKGQKRWHGMIMFAINFFLSLIYLHWQTITHSPTCKIQALFLNSNKLICFYRFSFYDRRHIVKFKVLAATKALNSIE